MVRMGLNERRKIKELQEVTFPGRVKEIEEICGAPIPYEVDWDSLSDDLEGLNFIDNLSCHRLNMALRVICQDEMGKEAVREGLKKVKLKNVKDKAAMKMTFGASGTACRRSTPSGALATTMSQSPSSWSVTTTTTSWPDSVVGVSGRLSSPRVASVST